MPEMLFPALMANKREDNRLLGEVSGRKTPQLLEQQCHSLLVIHYNSQLATLFDKLVCFMQSRLYIYNLDSGFINMPFRTFLI